MRRLLVLHLIDVLILDPAYLALATDGAESSIFAMGALLKTISELCQQCGVTLVLAHHTRKNIEDPFVPAELEHINWAGFQEFARQWQLISRRERYLPGTGEHRLWFNVGGSAGHSSLWAIDIFEGVYDGHTLRRWDVSVRTADEVRQLVSGARERQRQEQADERLERDKAAIVNALIKYPHGETKTVIRDASGLPTARANAATAALIRSGDIVPCEVAKPGRNAPYEGFKLIDVEGQL